MKRDNERIELLLERWLAAEATEAEERELREWFRHTRPVPPELRDAALLFSGMDEIAAERLPEKAARSAAPRCPLSPSTVEGSSGRSPERRRMLLWSAAAVAAVGVFLCAGLLRRPYCYIDGKAVYDRETALRTTEYLSSFSALDVSGQLVDYLMEND